MKVLYGILFCFITFSAYAQKKQLDHSVYDAWESIGEHKISNNGAWVVFAKTVQEGDQTMIIRETGTEKQIAIPRGYNAQFSANNRYVVMLVRPFYAATREARIKKKKPEEMPKDSLCIVDLSTGGINMKPGVKVYSMPKDLSGPIAVHLHNADSAKKASPETDEGSDLAIGILGDTSIKIVRNVSEFKWSKNGKLLVMEGRQSKAVKGSMNSVLIYRIRERRLDTISRGGNEFSNFDLDSNAYQIAFTAEKDSTASAPRKFHKLWYWKNGMDSAVMLADKNSEGMKLGWTVSENGEVKFSDSGDRILFGTAPIRPAKDTSVPEIDQVKVDIWNYKDDYLQTQQLYNLNREMKRTYLAMYDLRFRKLIQLANEHMRDVIPTHGGDGASFIGLCDTGRRVQTQWTGEPLRDVYTIACATGIARLVKKNLSAVPQPSPGGNYMYWFDEKASQYFTAADTVVRNVSQKVPYKLFDEDYDMPSSPNAYGFVKWLANDAGMLVYDKYDIWQLDPQGVKAPVCITGGAGRKNKTSYRYVTLDPDEKFIEPTKTLTLRSQREDNKHMGLASLGLKNPLPVKIMEGPFAVKGIVSSEETNVIGYTKESFRESTDFYIRKNGEEQKLSATNPQQASYSWGTAELVSWKAYDGRTSQGILYKPEGFDGSKKFPMICYFYERDSDSLFVYRAPAPVRSRIDISFFVSRGYVIFVPDIHYKKGYPGKGAYDYVVSGARAMVKKGGIDSTRIGIQGQSWGGYQVAHLITRTKMFAAAWAGAPVVNMTSAYGGIRWESGVNRQFQYEKTQSRIGATLWEKPQLYIENSPLFSLPRVSTPVVIMSNDNDGAVPWYQGIEMFTAMRRLGKKVWLLNYNGEEHNLVQRRNRKDLSIREQQYFDWILKGEKPPTWITDGVPATEKGRPGL